MTAMTTDATWRVFVVSTDRAGVDARVIGRGDSAMAGAARRSDTTRMNCRDGVARRSHLMRAPVTTHAGGRGHAPRARATVFVRSDVAKRPGVARCATENGASAFALHPAADVTIATRQGAMRAAREGRGLASAIVPGLLRGEPLPGK